MGAILNQELRVLTARRQGVPFAISLTDISEVGRLPRLSAPQGRSLGSFVLRGAAREVINPPFIASDIIPSMFIALRDTSDCVGVDELLALVNGRVEGQPGQERFIHNGSTVLPLLKK